MIELGEYVRTDIGNFFKYEGEVKEYVDNHLSLSNKKDIEFLGIIKRHSKNIIDLIEVGDYVNGHKIVSEIWGEDDNNLYFEIEGGFNKAILISENEIETILTKEQYEQNYFRVKE